MLRVKPLKRSSINAHYTRVLVEISGNYAHAHIPIKDENWAERWCVLPKEFEKVTPKIKDFEVRKDDIFVVTFLKCGTTWMQETVWILLKDLDFASTQKPFLERTPFLDLNGFIEFPVDMIELANNTLSPRLLKSHMPANLLPKQLWEKKPKIIYVARNAKDVICSFYHFLKGLKVWTGNLDEFVTEFLNNNIQNMPFWEHIIDFWRLRNEPHVFFVTYEEMKCDLKRVIQRLSQFLGKPSLTDEQLESVVEHLSFEKMKDNKNTNFGNNIIFQDETIDKDFKFMRRGIIGSFKDELTKEQRDRIDEWSNAILSKYGLKEEDIFGKF